MSPASPCTVAGEVYIPLMNSLVGITGTGDPIQHTLDHNVGPINQLYLKIAALGYKFCLELSCIIQQGDN